MKTFTIDAENNITFHATRQAARATGSGVFSNPEQFANLIGPDPKRLVEIWNSLTGVPPVRKFKDSKTATERIWKAIQNVGDAPASEALPQAANAPVETRKQGDVAPVSVALPEFESPSKSNEAAAPEDTLPATVAPHAPDVAQPEARAKRKATRGKKAPTAPTNAEGSRPASKTATVIALMKQPGGTTLHAIMQATGWQAHSVRGFVSGTLGKKMGLAVLSVKSESGERAYSLQP